MRPQKQKRRRKSLISGIKKKDFGFMYLVAFQEEQQPKYIKHKYPYEEVEKPDLTFDEKLEEMEKRLRDD